MCVQEEMLVHRIARRLSVSQISVSMKDVKNKMFKCLKYLLMFSFHFPFFDHNYSIAGWYEAERYHHLL
jgi:hypothetical protein